MFQLPFSLAINLGSACNAGCQTDDHWSSLPLYFSERAHAPLPLSPQCITPRWKTPYALVNPCVQLPRASCTFYDLIFYSSSYTQILTISPNRVCSNPMLQLRNQSRTSKFSQKLSSLTSVIRGRSGSGLLLNTTKSSKSSNLTRPGARDDATLAHPYQHHRHSTSGALKPYMSQPLLLAVSPASPTIANDLKPSKASQHSESSDDSGPSVAQLRSSFDQTRYHSTTHRPPAVSLCTRSAFSGLPPTNGLDSGYTPAAVEGLPSLDSGRHTTPFPPISTANEVHLTQESTVGLHPSKSQPRKVVRTLLNPRPGNSPRGGGGSASTLPSIVQASVTCPPSTVIGQSHGSNGRGEESDSEQEAQVQGTLSQFSSALLRRWSRLRLHFVHCSLPLSFDC